QCTRAPRRAIPRQSQPRSRAYGWRRVACHRATAVVTRRPGGRTGTPRMTELMDVVIVDDEPAARRTLREFCATERDLRVTAEYGDGQAALEAIRANPPDLLFLDIQMPFLTGIELARGLDAASLPLIVFVTAYDQYSLEAFEVSAIDYLLKPFDEARLRKTLVRVRRRRNAENPGDRQATLLS